MMEHFRAFSKQLLGTHYERIWQSAVSCAILFLSLSVAEIKIDIAPFILFLTATMFTAGVMWQALSSSHNEESLMGVFMLPFKNRPLVFAYVGAFSIYTLITKSALLLAVLIAVGDWNTLQMIGALLFACNACAVAAACYSVFQRKYLPLILVWTMGLVAIIFFVHHIALVLGAVVISLIFSLFCLLKVDAYTFYRPVSAKRVIKLPNKNGNIYVYLFRYLMTHKRYLVNTAGMWGMACFLPFLFGKLEGLNMLPFGFAILTLNTPICILLSCDPDLEQAIRVLPGQGARFGAWYCLFIFTFNLVASAIYLISWQLQYGGVGAWAFLTAVLFGLQSAILSVMLEWLRPLRNWKVESDLWHHPRKYCVPLVMIVLAVLVSTFPIMTMMLLALVVLESAGLLLIIRRA